MTGLSIGYFVAQALHDEIEKVAQAVPAMLTGGSRTFPRRERPIYLPDAVLSGVRYVAVGGTLPFAAPLRHLQDGRVFRFIIAAIGRPAMMFVPDADQRPIMERPQALQDSMFRLGGIELQRGMAIHFDRRSATECLVSLPQRNRAAVNALPPGYVAIEVDGFDAGEIELAHTLARFMIERDRAFWNRSL